MTSYVYDGSTGALTSATDAAGNVTAYAYDAQGHVTRRTDPLGKVWI